MDSRGAGFSASFPRSFRSTQRKGPSGRGVNGAVRIGGIEIAAGDYVLADGSGTALVAAAHIGEVVRHAERIVARERLIVEALRLGERATTVLRSE